MDTGEAWTSLDDYLQYVLVVPVLVGGGPLVCQTFVFVVLAVGAC